MTSDNGSDIFISRNLFAHHHFDQLASIPVATAPSAHATVHECPVCQRQFATKKYLSMHAALHKTGSTPTGNVVVDDDVMSQSSVMHHHHQHFCQTLGSRGVRQDPGTTHQHHQQQQQQQHQQQQQPSWACPICGKTFAQNSNFRNHVRTHSDERPYVCLVCFIGFKERYHLKKHALFKHSGELKEQCRQCGKRFKDLTAVRAHERTHSDLRPYRCDRCEKTFKTSECLWHHENRSKTCGRPPGEVLASGGGSGSGGGRRRNKQAARNADAPTIIKTAKSRPPCDNGGFDSASSSSSSTATPVKVEATIGQLDSMNDFDLDLDLDGDLCQFNGFQWSSSSGADLAEAANQPFDYRKSSFTVDDVTVFPTPASDQSFSPQESEVVDFRLTQGAEIMMTQSPNRHSIAICNFGMEYEVKSFYDVIENQADPPAVDPRDIIIQDCRFDPGQTGARVSHHTAGRSQPHLSLPECCHDDVAEIHISAPSSTFSNGSSTWYSSVPTAIVAPMQRIENQSSVMESQCSERHHQQPQHHPHHHHQQQQQHQAHQPNHQPPYASCKDAKYSLPPFETFVPPRKSVPRPTTTTRPQHQQYPTVARCLLQPQQTCATTTTRFSSNDVIRAYDIAPYQRPQRTVYYHVVEQHQQQHFHGTTATVDRLLTMP